mmetsp:Transcript_66001/g.104507  ORF Transcript_66001/g.104507 Transcript_66001/m.104507 type:complete len:112 (+) Transcript_66001:88-423(+)
MSCDLGCNCRCGESCSFIGIFVFAAAIVFWLIGALLQVCVPYGPAWMDWFHPLNMWFFKLGGVLTVAGVVMAVVLRKGKAFSREPLIQVEEQNGSVNKDGVAPIPYVMLPA